MKGAPMLSSLGGVSRAGRELAQPGAAVIR